MGDRSQRPPTSLHEQRTRRVVAAFRDLPDRFLGAEPQFEATFQIKIGDVGRTWEVRVHDDRCEVRTTPGRRPDVVLGTDASTWLALREGRLSGIDAFTQRRLEARGDLDLALAFEGLFRLPGGRVPHLRLADVEPAGVRIRTLVAGDGAEHVICLHGLGANKVSFSETIAALAPAHTVHALDLPGFGASSKPARAPYDAPWFARTVADYMHEAGIERAHLVGNSMGGRIALEVAFTEPRRVSSLSLFAPSMAWTRRRHFVPLVKLIRPELAAIPHPLREATVRRQLHGMFARPERLDPAAAEIAADEFCRAYRSRAARVAFFAALRNIYLDEPYGQEGFWERLRELEPPALFIWGDSDKLVPAGFAKHVAQALPGARQVVLPECGHVPQIELAEEANRLVREHIVAHEGDAARPRGGTMIAGHG